MMVMSGMNRATTMKPTTAAIKIRSTGSISLNMASMRRFGTEVMTAFTGDAFFPGGFGQHVVPATTGLAFESGPSVPITLQWGTYFDAADQAGLSRLPGGIHVEADDFDGRVTGSQIGIDAYNLAQQYFVGF